MKPPEHGWNSGGGGLLTEESRSISIEWSREEKGLRISRLPEQIFALLLLLATAPLMLLIAAAILLLDGPPVLFKQLRYGKGKRLFLMYKFRTLKNGAEQTIGGQVIETQQKRELLTHCGPLLRASKLDELPQLYNVLTGDMAIVGPRPQRPLIHENTSRRHPDYEKRLRVRPGLLGYPQLFLPHNAPKRMQYFFDARYIRLALAANGRKNRLMNDIQFLLQALAVGTFRLLQINWSAFRGWRAMQRPAGAKRAFTRVALPNCQVFVDDCPVPSGKLLNISEDAFCWLGQHHLDAGQHLFRLVLPQARMDSCDRPRNKSARLVGEVIKYEHTPDTGWRQVVQFRPSSAFHGYILHQYFLSGRHRG